MTPESEITRLRARYKHWWKQAMEARRERNALKAQLVQLHAASDVIFAAYHEILALFDCPAHGECAPYAIQRIKEYRAIVHKLAGGEKQTDAE